MKLVWGKMEHDYKNIISHIDIDRSLGAIHYFSFEGYESELISGFWNDISGSNDTIELHLIKSSAYKEALVLTLKKVDENHAHSWRESLREEQKTFGGSKIFYIDDECTRLLMFALHGEMTGKISMLISRLNKINEKITRINSKIRKENNDLYLSRIRDKEVNKKKDEIINLINQNLRV